MSNFPRTSKPQLRCANRVQLSAIILAGGKSRRMGRDKAWVKLGGRPLLELAVEKVRRLAVEELFISGRADRLTGAVPSLRGEFEPLAAIYPKRCHAFAFEALARSRRSARDFAAACLRERAIRTLHVSATDAPCFANWNCPSDLAGGN